MADERKDYSEFISDGFDIRVKESPKDRDTKTEDGESKARNNPSTPAGNR